MKKVTYILIALLLSSYSNAAFANVKIQIKNLPGKLIINKGPLTFPNKDTLKKYGLVLKYDSTGETYSLQGEENNVNSYDGNVVISGNTVIKNSVIINGETITINSNENNKTTKVFVITVPDSTYDFQTETQYDIEINCPICNLDLDITGGPIIKIYSVENIGELNITGSSDVKIEKCKVVKDIEIIGSATIDFKNCNRVSSIEIIGSGTVTVPRNTEIGVQEIIGNGSVGRN